MSFRFNRTWTLSLTFGNENEPLVFSLELNVIFSWMSLDSERIRCSRQTGEFSSKSSKLPGIKNLGWLIFIFKFCKNSESITKEPGNKKDIINVNTPSQSILSDFLVPAWQAVNHQHKPYQASYEYILPVWVDPGHNKTRVGPCFASKLEGRKWHKWNMNLDNNKA